MNDLKVSYPHAPRPWVDLSTGINPWPYPVPDMAGDTCRRLPQRDAEDSARTALAGYLGMRGEAEIVLTPGSQAAIQQLPFLVEPRQVNVLAPTYGEHAPAWHRAGHTVSEITRADVASAGTSGSVLVVTQPNNPDGAVIPPAELLTLAADLGRKGGLLVVDEAFADLCPETSIAGQAAGAGAVVFRSFGKFFGLAGIRAGAMIAPPDIAAALSARLGPWAVSGPALAIMAQAYADTAWISQTRARLAAASRALDGVLVEAKLQVVGGTSLFRLAATPRARVVHETLARHGLWVRHFERAPNWLRFGLPPTDDATARLADALRAASKG